tara:strand:- start:392 stop:943 length:552 start_codon:yes stop_codon:yes gene_type:complete
LINASKVESALKHFDLQLLVSYLEAKREAKCAGVKEVLNHLQGGDREFVKAKFTKDPHLPAFLGKLKEEEVEIWQRVLTHVAGATFVGNLKTLNYRDNYVAFDNLMDRKQYWYNIRLMDIFSPYEHKQKIRQAIKAYCRRFNRIRENLEFFFLVCEQHEKKVFPKAPKNFFKDLSGEHLDEGW